MWLIGVDAAEKKDPRKPVQAFEEKATALTRRVAEEKRAGRSTNGAAGQVRADPRPRLS